MHEIDGTPTANQTMVNSLTVDLGFGAGCGWRCLVLHKQRDLCCGVLSIDGALPACQYVCKCCALEPPPVLWNRHNRTHMHTNYPVPKNFFWAPLARPNCGIDVCFLAFSISGCCRLLGLC
jgi:hypothetical protein